MSLPPFSPRALARLRVAAVIGVLALLLGAQRLGLFQQFADPASVKQALVQLGPRGYLAFIAAYALLQPFGVPGTVFIMAAPLIWPWPVAFALSMAGTMAASIIGFSFARFIARDWIAARVPQRFRRYDAALAERGFTTVFLLRLVFWMPPLLHAFFGVSQVPFATHLLGSLLGYVPPLLLVSYFGPKVLHALKDLPWTAWVGIAAASAALGLVLWRGGVWHRARKARS